MRTICLLFTVLLLAAAASALAPTNPGDLNADLVVDVQDILLVNGQLGKSPLTDTRGDPNNDGKADLFDFVHVTKNWGRTYSTGSSLPAGLLLAYGFDGGQAADSSGNGLTGVLNGPSLTAGRYGDGLHFDGTSDYIVVGNPAILSDRRPLTVTAWVKASGFGYVVSKRMGSCTGYWRLSVETGNFSWLSRGVSAVSNSAFPSNTWVHIAATLDSNNVVHLYQDGQDVTTMSSTGSSGSSDASCALTIGSRDSTSALYPGDLDEVRIYDRALTQAEIIQDMNSGTGTYTPPPPDTTDPTVSFTTPTAGAVVSGVAALTVAAADNVGIQNVQFMVDGSNYGAPDANSPYTVNWDTTAVTNGAHTLGARATDTSGNTALATISVTANNVAAACGNNVKEGTEQCDGTDLGGATCTSLGYTGGTLSCTNCNFNTAQCTSPAGGSYPNKPAHMTNMIASNPMNALPGPYSVHTVPGAVGLWAHQANWRTPTVVPGTITSVWADALAGGSGGSQLSGWSSIEGRDQYQEVYTYHRYAINPLGNDFQQNGLGYKQEWLHSGYAGANNGFIMIMGNGVHNAILTQGALQWRTQGFMGQANRGANVPGGKVFTYGPFHTIEIYAKNNNVPCQGVTNTYGSGSATVGLSNGILKIWVDGALTLDYSDMCWSEPNVPNNSGGFFMWSWSPTNGGGGSPRTREDVAAHDEVTIFAQ